MAESSGNAQGGSDSEGGGSGIGTAIVGVVGQAVGAIGGFITSREQRRLAYQNWLNYSIPTFKQFNQGNSTLIYSIILGAFFVTIIILAIVTAYRQK